MRLSCKVFSMLSSLAAALFYDFNVFATRQSITNLKLLSQHSMLRRHVRRLVFCRPPPQVQASFLKNAPLAESCGRFISRFPNLASVFISDSVPDALNLDFRAKPDDAPSARKKRRRDAIRDEGQEDRDTIWAANHHTAFVVRTLALAKVRLQELVTYDDWGPTWEFSWDLAPDCLDRLDLSGLDRLDVCLRDGSEAPGGGADWSGVLCPLLAKAPALTELYLRFDCRRNMHPTVSGIWELSLPGLAVLSVYGLTMPQTTFCTFLRRHVHLRELTLHYVRESAGRWHAIFTHIREHSALEDLELMYLDKCRLDCPISTFSQPELSDDVTLELYDYLHGDGGWTDRLSKSWNR